MPGHGPPRLQAKRASLNRCGRNRQRQSILSAGATPRRQRHQKASCSGNRRITDMLFTTTTQITHAQPCHPAMIHFPSAAVLSLSILCHLSAATVFPYRTIISHAARALAPHPAPDHRRPSCPASLESSTVDVFSCRACHRFGALCFGAGWDLGLGGTPIRSIR